MSKGSTGQAALVGRVLDGKYRLEERLASGGQGAVYRAAHVETGGLVAIKVLRLVADDHEKMLKRFRLEAANTHRLRHPNTVRVFDFGQEALGATGEELPYLVMEYLEGRPLSAAMKEGPMPVERVVHVARQVLKALGEAHDQKVIHRDIKPRNILLVDHFGETDYVKVLDFGISRCLEGDGASTAGSIGTPRYMAPEQFLNVPVDARTDLYALGVTMYEMLTGRSPWFDAEVGNTPKNAYAWMRAHLSDPPRPLRELVPEVPEALAELIHRMMERPQSGRPSGVAAVLATLEGRAPAPAPEPGPAGSSDSAPTPRTMLAEDTLESGTDPVELAYADTRSGPSESRRSAPALVPLALIALSLVVAAVALIVGPGGGPGPSAPEAVADPPPSEPAPPAPEPEAEPAPMPAPEPAAEPPPALAAPEPEVRGAPEPDPEPALAPLRLGARGQRGVRVTLVQPKVEAQWRVPFEVEAPPEVVAQLAEGGVLRVELSKPGFIAKRLELRKEDVVDQTLTLEVRLQKKSGRKPPPLPGLPPELRGK